MTKPTLSSFNTLAEIMIQTYERYLPTAFDESLTLLEKVNKVIDYLNQIGKMNNELVVQWNSVMEWVMNEGLTEDVNDRLDLMVTDGTLDRMINQTRFTEFNQQLDSKVDKNSPESVTMDMLSQTVKTALTGGSVAVVGTDAVSTSHLVEKSVIPQKTDFFNYKFQNLLYLSSDKVSYTTPANTTSATFGNGKVDFVFSGINQAWIKMDGLISGKQYFLMINHDGEFTQFHRFASDKQTNLGGVTDFATRQKYYVWFTPTESSGYIRLNNNGGGLNPSITYFKLYQIDNNADITGYYDSVNNTLNENPTLKINMMGKELSGIKGNAIGDSITANVNGYVKYVGQLLNITYNNKGVSGELVGSVLNRLNDLPVDVDFNTLFEGTNNFNASEPLGSKTDPATQESGTFYGRYRAVIEALLTRYPTKPLILITPLQRAYNVDDGNVKTMINTQGWTLLQYVNIIKDLGVEYGLPVIDLYSTSGMSPYNLNTYTTDGLHPNDSGSRKIASIIADEIKRHVSITV